MDQHKYHPVYSSEADGGRPLLDFHRRPNTNLYTILVGLVIAIALFVLGAFVGTYVSRSKSQYISTKDPRSLVPDFAAVRTVFQPNYDYWNFTDPASTQAWKDLVPRGHIIIEHPEQYGLEPGIPVSPFADRYVMSGTHSIHCLRIIRESFVTMMTGNRIPSAHPFKAHPEHCFDYLRQYLQCNLKLDFEKARVDQDGKRRSADGWGVSHQCVDFGKVLEWIDDSWQYEKSHPDWKLAYDSDPLPAEPLNTLPICTFPDDK